MILGAVSDSGKAMLPLRVRRPGGCEIAIEAIVDTGFDGVFAIGVGLVAALQLAPDSGGLVKLADDSWQSVPEVEVEILWHGRWIEADALVLGDEVLAGMSLLHGSDLHVEAVEGGAVTVVERPDGA